MKLGIPAIRAAVAAATAACVLAPLPAASAGVSSLWNNCTMVHTKYPHGIGRAGAHDRTRSGTNPVTNFKRSTRLYNLATRFNSDLDRDRDGVACEAH
jgi:Excalibur calcium-binding domain